MSETEDDLKNAGNEIHTTPKRTDQAGKMPNAETDNMAGNKDEKSRSGVLDLTLPEDISFEDLSTGEAYAEPPPIFDAKKLFKQKKEEGKLSIKVTPNVQAGESLTEMPSVDGGSVEVTVKTE